MYSLAVIFTLIANYFNTIIQDVEVAENVGFGEYFFRYCLVTNDLEQ